MDRSATEQPREEALLLTFRAQNLRVRNLFLFLFRGGNLFQRRIVRVAHSAPVRVKLPRVLLEQVVRGQVRTPAEPGRPGHREPPDVRPERGDHRGLWVDDHGERRGAVRLAPRGVDAIPAPGGHGLGALGGEDAPDYGHVRGSLFEDVAALEDAGHAESAPGLAPHPRVQPELAILAAVERLHIGDEIGLHGHHEPLELVEVDAVGVDTRVGIVGGIVGGGGGGGGGVGGDPRRGEVSPRTRTG